MSAERIEYIDRLRGLAMMLVVAGHVLFYCGYASSPLCYAIYAFHMPLFFVISGWVNHYVWKPTDAWTYLKKTCLRLILPYAIWSMVYVVIQSLRIGGAIDTAYSLLPVSDYWFIPCLFILHWIHYAVCAIEGSVWKRVCVLVGLLGVVIGLYAWTHYGLLKHVIAYILPYAFGVMLVRKPEVLKMITEKWWIALINTIVGVGLMVVYYYAPNGGSIAQVARLICGLCMSSALIYVYRKASTMVWTLKRGKIESYIGKCTLGIYFIHFMIVREWILPADMGLALQAVTTIGSMAALIALCLGLMWVLGLIPYAGKILFGK